MVTQPSAAGIVLPKVSYIIAIDAWHFMCLIFVFASVIEFAVVNVLARRCLPPYYNETMERRLSADDEQMFIVSCSGRSKAEKLDKLSRIVSKIEWKKLTKSAINEHWTNKLRLECEEKSTLQNLAISNLGIGVTHPVWATVSSSVSNIRKAITKSRMLTGTSLLQAHRHRFNQAEVDPICPNCRTETEDLCHVLTTCPLYMNIRIALNTPINNFILSIISETK
ncbi:unnamed protein product [Mytilus coruscus]|uniref:Neurotransmitter-gated ion-channel transmembrane domain-containing protein n=1 Tax=Mytilus coruscus TaxID=42192 RepID=A0A6J8E5F6_MYTCO|nr:unnamed protein product [Mytilus coruscus]